MRLACWFNRLKDRLERFSFDKAKRYSHGEPESVVVKIESS